jgi:hypothetical protein
MRNPRFVAVVGFASGLLSIVMVHFADISHRVAKGKETKVSVFLKQRRVSPEVVEAMRVAPAPAQTANEETPDGDESTPSAEPEAAF